MITIFESKPGYTQLGYKDLTKAKEKFPIDTVFAKYVPASFKEQLDAAKEFMGEHFFIPEKMWSYKILKPKEILGEVAEFQVIKKIKGYYLDENGTYWPVVQDKKTHNLNFVFVPIEEREKYY